MVTRSARGKVEGERRNTNGSGKRRQKGGSTPEPNLTKALETLKESSGGPQKSVDTEPPAAVDSTQINSSEVVVEATSEPNPEPRTTNMTLTLKGTSKNGKVAFYSGAAQTVRLQTGLFAGGTAPQAIEVPDGTFLGAKVKLTKEERKAARATAPKPTLAEKIAKREAALARLREKAAKEASGAPAI